MYLLLEAAGGGASKPTTGARSPGNPTVGGKNSPKHAPVTAHDPNGSIAPSWGSVAWVKVVTTYTTHSAPPSPLKSHQNSPQLTPFNYVGGSQVGGLARTLSRKMSFGSNSGGEEASLDWDRVIARICKPGLVDAITQVRITGRR